MGGSVVVLAGEVLSDRYRVGDELGHGGMADVYLAVDTLLDREVAVKLLAPHRIDDDGTFVARFRREARAAASLNHPNVVTVHDTGSDRGRHFIVMERVTGPTLQQVLRDEGRLDVERAVRVAADISAALAAAHAQGLVHRDIKPGNVMFDLAGRVKVADFGIARAVAETTAGTGGLFGSVGYIAPEQARGDQVDGRADLYSLGCVLYEMLTGRPPFTSSEPLTVVHRHLHRRPDPPSSLVAGITPALDRLVLRALSKHPVDRHPTAAAFRADLLAAAVVAPHAPEGDGATRLLTGGGPTVAPRLTGGVSTVASGMTGGGAVARGATA
ncbi:MAG TPA: protein kinase, partial [Nitriliruptorales bacterium]|nr:protein kinase [Nitriliruptorales bacterium]